MNDSGTTLTEDRIDALTAAFAELVTLLEDDLPSLRETLTDNLIARAESIERDRPGLAREIERLSGTL